MKLDSKRTIFVGFAFMSICAFWQVYDGITPLILKNTFDVNDALSGLIMALDNLLALFLLPVFGLLSDKNRSRLGRRTPYIIFGTLAACVLMFLLPIADRIRSLALFAVGLGAVLLVMSTYRSPAVALMPDVTPKPLRSKANAIINLMGAVGGIVSLGAIALLARGGERPDYLPVFIFTAVFMALCVFILIKKINEPKLCEKMRAEYPEDFAENASRESGDGKMDRATRRSFGLILASVFLWFMGYNAVSTAFSKYASVYWGLTGGSYAYTLMVAQVAAIASYIPAGLLATRIGRRKTILIGVALITAALAAGGLFKSFSFVVFILFVFAGMGWATINVNSYPMVVEMSRGGNVGKYTGYYYTASQLAQIITPILSGAVLEYGYLLLGSSNPDAGYVFLFPYGAIFCALSFVTMMFVRHGDSKPRKAVKLEAFDVE